MTARQIGFIGVGEMGQPMAERLVAAGHDVAICDRSESALAHFRRAGLRVSAAPRDVAGGDIVIVMVSDDTQLMAVAAGESGLSGGLARDRRPVVVVMSTCLPDVLRTLDGILRPAGARLVDAPVSGGRAKAERGELSAMIGGEESSIEAVEHVLSAMANRLFRCGPLGAASTTKLINNMLGLVNLRLMAEALEIGRASGLSARTLFEALDASSGRNLLTGDPGVARQLFASWTRTPELLASLAAIIDKDLSHACEVARESRVEAAVFEGVRRALSAAPTMDLERWRALARWLEAPDER